MAEGNLAANCTGEYTITQQPQDDTSEYYHKTQVLPKSHAVIVYSSLDPAFEGGTDRETSFGQILGEALERPESIGEGQAFKVVFHDVTKEISDETLTKDIRACLKVIVVFSKNMLNVSNERLMREWKVITDMTSERHMECVIPVLHGMEASEILPQFRESSVMPSGFLEDCIKSNEQYYKSIVKLLSEAVVIGSGDFLGIGKSLAWSHFFGWLYLVLQGLRERVLQTAAATSDNWCRIPKDFYLHPKMIAIIPKRGYSTRFTSLNDYDPNVRALMKKKDNDPTAEEPVKAKYTEQMLGYPDKDYSNPLHYTTVDDKTYVFVAEVPTTLKTLMHLQTKGFTKKFEHEEHLLELHRFKAQLERIMTSHSTDKDDHQNHENRRQAITLIYFDEDKAAEKPLSQLIADTIESEIAFQNAPSKP